jgi:hypothetical protein
VQDAQIRKFQKITIIAWKILKVVRIGIYFSKGHRYGFTLVLRKKRTLIVHSRRANENKVHSRPAKVKLVSDE